MSLIYFSESKPKCFKGAQIHSKDTTMKPQGHPQSTKSLPNVFQR